MPCWDRLARLWQRQVKTLSYMTWEHIETIKLIKLNIKSDKKLYVAYFVLKYDKNGNLFN